MPLPINNNAAAYTPAPAGNDGEVPAVPPDVDGAPAADGPPPADEAHAADAAWGAVPVGEAAQPIPAGAVAPAGGEDDAVLHGTQVADGDLKFTAADMVAAADVVAAANPAMPEVPPMSPEQAGALADAMNQLPADPALQQAVLQAAVSQPSPAAYVFAVSTAMRFGANVTWGRPLVSSSLPADWLKDLANPPVNQLQQYAPADSTSDDSPSDAGRSQHRRAIPSKHKAASLSESSSNLINPLLNSAGTIDPIRTDKKQ